MKKTFLPLMLAAAFMSFATLGNAQTDKKEKKKEDKKEQTSTKSEKPGERKLHISDYIKVGGFINTQYEYTNQEHNDGSLAETSAFQIRRARLDVKGDITPMIDFRLQADFANSPKLVDAFVRVKFCKYINLQVGQFKIPFTLENPYSPLDLEFADNAQVITALSGYKDVTGIGSYATGRELGAQLYGTLAEFERGGKKYPMLSYAVGVFSGVGINMKTDNMAKDIAGRIEFRPFLKDLKLTGSAYWGRYQDANMDNLLRLRCTGGAEYKDEHLTVRGEYVWGNTGFSMYNLPTLSYTEDRMKTHGFYVVAGYWLNCGWGKYDKFGVSQKIRPVIRYDYYKKDLAADNSASTYYSLGLDWWPEKHLQFRVSYTLRDVAKYDKLGHGFNTMLSVKF